jgi:AraC-like DNA-binding protein
MRSDAKAAGAPVGGSVVFSTRDVEPAGRFETWRSRFGSVNDVAAPPDERADFRARTELWKLGPMVLGVTSNPARRIARTAAQCARDDIDHWVLRVTRSGAALMRTEEQCAWSRPGEVQIGSLAAPYVEDRTAGEWVGLFVPRDAYPEIDAGLRAQGARVATGATASLLATFLLSLADRMPQTSPDDIAPMTEAARGMIAACLLGDAAPRAMREGDRARLERLRVESLIRDAIGSPALNAERICALAGLSRSALYRLFEPRGGVAAHVLRLRLDLVRCDLGDPALAEAPIARIAARRGFSSVASFTRAYGRAFGETPGDTRRRAAALLIGPGRAQPDARTRDLAAVLR